MNRKYLKSKIGQYPHITDNLESYSAIGSIDGGESRPGAIRWASPWIFTADLNSTHAVSLFARTPGGITDKGIVIGQEAITRAIQIPNNSWKTLRIGMRFRLEGPTSNSSQLTVSPVIAMGLCSGTDSPYPVGNAGATRHFVGWLLADHFWTWQPSSLSWSVNGSPLFNRPIVTVNGVTTDSGSDFSPQVPGFISGRADQIVDPQNRYAAFVEITRDSPKYHLKAFGKLLSNSADRSELSLPYALLHMYPFPANEIGSWTTLDPGGQGGDYGLTAAQDITVDERSNGQLETINIYYQAGSAIGGPPPQVSQAMEISDVSVVKVA